MKNLQSALDAKISPQFVFQIKEGYRPSASLEQEQEVYADLLSKTTEGLKADVEKSSTEQEVSKNLKELNEFIQYPFKDIKVKEYTFTGDEVISIQLARFFKEKGRWTEKEGYYVTKKAMEYLTNEFGININDPKNLEGITLFLNDDDQNLSIGRNDLEGIVISDEDIAEELAMEKADDEMAEELANEAESDEFEIETEPTVIDITPKTDIEMSNEDLSDTKLVKEVEIEQLPENSYIQGKEKLRAADIPTKYSLKNKGAVDALLNSDLKKTNKAERMIKKLAKIKALFMKYPEAEKAFLIKEDQVITVRRANGTQIEELSLKDAENKQKRTWKKRRSEKKILKNAEKEETEFIDI